MRAEAEMAKDVDTLVRELAEGRTDLVFELIAAGVEPDRQDDDGVSLLKWCVYYGDVSAIKFLLSKGVELASLGANLDLNGTCFHGHWRLCRFLLEQGADPNAADSQNGETPLHCALCTTDRVQHDRVLQVLLSAGANPNVVTKNGAETEGFMRDVRTKGETPLHRAAAFGNEATIELLLKYGAKVDVQDAYGDSPLSWGSWHVRPDSILRPLCFGNFRIRPARDSMRGYLVGRPWDPPSTT
jgi:ankyrin repeat protein